MNSYKDYLYYLLHAPFKKVKKEINQWKILMKVFGSYFDEVKEYIFIIREETSLETATNSIALDVIAIGMRMYRFEKETDDQFRKRLLAKRAIAEMAGTKHGILYALNSLGYEDAKILPVPSTNIDLNRWNGRNKWNGKDKWHSSVKDEEHWAEFMIVLNAENPKATKNLELLKSEIRKIKQASSLPVYHFKTSEVTEVETITEFELLNSRLEITFETVFYMEISMLFENMKIKTTNEISTSGIIDNVSRWNGIRKWNGEKKWNSSIIPIEMEE